MKPVYIRMFIDKLYGETWKRMFHKHKSEVEFISSSVLYIRGMGGGHHMNLLKKDQQYVYFRKSVGVTENYRIARADYDRLLNKVAQLEGIHEEE